MKNQYNEKLWEQIKYTREKDVEREDEQIPLTHKYITSLSVL